MSTHQFSLRGSLERIVPLVLVGALASLAFAQASLTVAEHDEHGSYLADQDGMSLYAFLPDAEEEGSACYGDCAEAWPPLTTDAETEVSDNVDAELVGTIERTEGPQQVTYDGWPLYYFVQDEEAGDVAGQGVGDNWYLVAPDGTLIGADLEADGEAEGESDGGGAELDMETLMADGERIYNAQCAGCHGEDGDEANGSHVRLIVEAERTVSDPNRLVRQIMYGGSYMPGFSDTFSDEELIAVATYVRNSFGFDQGPVGREEVVEERERFN